MKWPQILWQLMRDVLFTGLGTWIIWKQVYAAVPNPYLLLFAGACFWPASRYAVTTLLSGPGSSSEPQHLPSGPPSESSPHGDGTDEHA